MGPPCEAGGGLPLEAGPCKFNPRPTQLGMNPGPRIPANLEVVKHNVIKLVGHFYSNYTL